MYVWDLVFDYSIMCYVILCCPFLFCMCMCNNNRAVSDSSLYVRDVYRSCGCDTMYVCSVILCMVLFLQELYSFVGAQDSVNPRHFCLLASDVPQPQLLEILGTLAVSGLRGFVLIIAENIKVCTKLSCDVTEHDY